MRKIVMVGGGGSIAQAAAKALLKAGVMVATVEPPTNEYKLNCVSDGAFRELKGYVEEPNIGFGPVKKGKGGKIKRW